METLMKNIKTCKNRCNIRKYNTARHAYKILKCSCLVKTFVDILHDSTTKTQQRERLLAYILVVLLFVCFVLKKCLLTLSLGIRVKENTTLTFQCEFPKELSSAVLFEYKFHRQQLASDSGIWKCPSDVHFISLGNGGRICSWFRITAAFVTQSA